MNRPLLLELEGLRDQFNPPSQNPQYYWGKGAIKRLAYYAVGNNNKEKPPWQRHPHERIFGRAFSIDGAAKQPRAEKKAERARGDSNPWHAVLPPSFADYAVEKNGVLRASRSTKLSYEPTEYKVAPTIN